MYSLRRGTRNARATLGSYGAGQLEAVLARVLAEHTTIAFDFQPQTFAGADDDTVYARASWVQRPRGESQSLTQWLTFTWSRWHQDGVWRLVEMRSSP